jgi:hypothetical protein
VEDFVLHPARTSFQGYTQESGDRILADVHCCDPSRGGKLTSLSQVSEWLARVHQEIVPGLRTLHLCNCVIGRCLPVAIRSNTVSFFFLKILMMIQQGEVSVLNKCRADKAACVCFCTIQNFLSHNSSGAKKSLHVSI